MKLLTTLCCAALAVGGALYAQTPSEHMTVHFNSPVIVGQATLPAGACDIQVMRGSSDTTILVLRAAGGHSAAVVASHIPEGTEAESGSSVILNRQGNSLHLVRVLFEDRNGYQLNNAE